MVPDEPTTPAAAGTDAGTTSPGMGPHPVIGVPSSPPAALVVALSGRMHDITRRVRWRQFAVNVVGILAGTALAASAAFFASVHAQSGRAVAFGEAAALGGLLIAGVLVGRRQLELGTGVVSRTAAGGIALVPSINGLLLLVPGAFREAAEGLIYATGLVKADPAMELAAWLLMALWPPHGPPSGAWVSLSGIAAAGPFGLPEDLRAATRALSLARCIECDTSVYPPLVRMTPAGVEFVQNLVGRGR
jgi:hypothetical protein